MRFVLASIILVLVAGCGGNSSRDQAFHQGIESACTAFNRSFEKLRQPATVIQAIVFTEGDITNRHRLIASLDELHPRASDVPSLHRMIASFEEISSAELRVVAYLKALNPLRRAGMAALGKVIITRQAGEPLRKAFLRERRDAQAIGLPACVSASR